MKTYRDITRSVRDERGPLTPQHLTTSLLGPVPPGQVWIHAGGDRGGNRQGNLITVCRDEAISPKDRRRIGARARQRHQQRHEEPHAC
ncbi:hypothetical protein GCM10025871_40470 [Deinococcus metallilatus]|nr:hypothetical protein GCM10025871_40470 [Deinococcus metallilatus]